MTATRSASVLGLVQVVGGEQDRRAGVGQALDQAPELAAGLRVEAGGRLVQEQQLGAADDAERDVEPAALAAGQAGRAGVALLRQADQLDRLVRPHRVGEVGRHRADPLAHGQLAGLGQVVDPLQDDADAGLPLGGRPGRVVPEHRHVAAVPAAVALEDLDRRRLAGPVRPEQREHLAALAPSRSSPSTAARPWYVLRSPATRIAASLMQQWSRVPGDPPPHPTDRSALNRSMDPLRHQSRYPTTSSPGSPAKCRPFPVTNGSP